MNTHQLVEYIWIDAEGGLRGKTKVIWNKEIKILSDLPRWNFDGSSTKQSKGSFSDVFLFPKRIYRDPFRDGNALLILCECYDDAGRYENS